MFALAMFGGAASAYQVQSKAPMSRRDMFRAAAAVPFAVALPAFADQGNVGKGVTTCEKGKCKENFISGSNGVYAAVPRKPVGQVSGTDAFDANKAIGRPSQVDDSGSALPDKPIALGSIEKVVNQPGGSAFVANPARSAAMARLMGN